MLKRALKAVIKQSPYRLIRARDANRFQAVEECLISLRNRGFDPRVILDGGANVGAFARCATSIFKTAQVHLIEPQPACHDALTEFAQSDRYTFHPVAIGADRSLIDFGVDPDGITTGAHVIAGPNSESVDLQRIQVPVFRLDQLIGTKLIAEDRCLLKLDLQGWELEALKGTQGILDRIEVILTEVSFFAIAFEPSIEELIHFLDERGFALYDIASLSARGRDNRAYQSDFVFVRRDSPLMADRRWL